MPYPTDLDLTAKDVAELASPDAITALLTKLGYDTSDRTPLTPEAVGLAGESASAIRRIELLSADPEQFLRVVFAQVKSLTAKVRNDLVRVLGKSNLNHLLILASDFDTLEFVFLDKRKREQKGPIGGERIQVVPKTFKLDRRHSTSLERRILRRFEWTCRDALEQFDKLRSVFDAAAYTGEYYQNRGLFSDYFLRDRLRDDPAWRDNPSEMFAFVRDLLRDAQARWSGKDKDTLRNQLLEPLFKKLGYKAKVNRLGKTTPTEPDYLLNDGDGGKLTAAFVYAWGRWLDGPDLNDTDTPEENPGACVVTALDQGTADWIIVTNGRLWRIYSRQAHARATNFYEVDLVEALTASGDTDPNEAFRYWWLFLRPQAFIRAGSVSDGKCWLDDILFGSREYAKRLGDRLKDRIFLTIFPQLAQGILVDRKQRLGQSKETTEEELADIFEATLTLLYRLLFLLYAESRDLLPIREAAYQAASFKKIKDEIADKAGVAESDVAERLNKAYSPKETTLYDRLCTLFVAMDKGDPILNVPTYNGGLFNTTPLPSPPLRGRGAGGEGVADRRDQRIARFLTEHKVPDRYLALAIDQIARDQDERSLALDFIDYKSLEVRHLGSIYEGLLEFKLKVADEDLTTQADKKGETYIALSKAQASRMRKRPEVVVGKNEVYLSNDKAERKASGSYYTPDSIVEYIVANTVGPVLEEKLEALRPEFRKVRKTFDRLKANADASPHLRAAQDSRSYAQAATFSEHKDLVEQLFDLRVLDPAMGSGHFLVETVDFVTDHLLKFLNQFPINPVNFALDRTRTSILESLGEQGVTVDPNKLTDINLLKRHVLKRCIYGVDLNPMAVELAKVSLWLDAFTLGAPLNFLDHHLRCGNSLIGATFKNLEEATATLFGLNYEPLLRAINHVLFVSKMADATAAEVASSIGRYDQARQSLAGYQIVLDMLVAEHFGLPEAALLVKEGHELDLKSREELLASLHDDKERQLVAQVEALAQRPERRFFHWETEFPEVFFGFIDADERQLKHKEKILEGSAGFDCVVGNPPWGQKQIDYDESVKKYVWSNYPSTQGIFDFFRPFVELGTRLLQSRGSVGMVLPDIVLLKDYIETRRHLLNCLTLRAIDWWGMAFADAVIDSATVIGAKMCPAIGHNIRIHVHDPETPLTQDIPQDDFRANPRFVFNLFLTPEKRQALNRLNANPRLGEFFEVHEGVHSGNIRKDLFVDKMSDETCRELYFGRDEIAPYYLRWDGRYIRLGAVPKNRQTQRYANIGQTEWHERAKLLVRRTGDYVLAAVDEMSRYASNNLFLVFPKRSCGLDLYGLCALLNTKLMTWYFRTIEPRQGRVFAELKIKHLSVFPLPAAIVNGNHGAELNDLGRQRTEVARIIAVASPEKRATHQQAAVDLDLQIESNVHCLFGVSDSSTLADERKESYAD